MAATAEQINAALDRYVAAFTEGDKDGYLAVFAEGATVADPVGADVATGAAEIAAFWDGVRALTPTITLVKTGTPRIAGGEVAVNLRAIADVGGTKMAVDIIDVMAFDDDGKVTSLRAYWDMADMAPI